MSCRRPSSRRARKLACPSPSLPRSLAYLFAPCKVGSKAANSQAAPPEPCLPSPARTRRRCMAVAGSSACMHRRPTLRSSGQPPGYRVLPLTSNVSRRSRRSLQCGNRQSSAQFVQCLRSRPARAVRPSAAGARWVLLEAFFNTRTRRSFVAHVPRAHPRSKPRRCRTASCPCCALSVSQVESCESAQSVKALLRKGRSRAVRPSAASARLLRLEAFSMQQQNALVLFGPGVMRSTTATANHSVKRTAPGVPGSAAYLKR